MDYRGPTLDDLANINALNRAFLTAISGSSANDYGVLSTRVMSPSQRARLSEVPFLLFSFREQDADYWQQLLDDDPQSDLIESSEQRDAAIGQLQVAGLGFLWQLAQRNPYAVRLVSGASVSWCEQISQLTLVGLLRRAAQRNDLLRLRFPDDTAIWQRLLVNGAQRNNQTRAASHHVALQEILTRGYASAGQSLPAAACTMRGPGRQVVQSGPGSIREPKV
ncbi:MAG: hypothetical protein ACR2RD_13965 [Woeseiaceae bacterium]